MISGYPGVRISDNGLAVAPFCPENAKSIKIRSLQYRGAVIDFEYSCSSSVTGKAEKLTVGLSKASRPFQLSDAYGKLIKTLVSGAKATIDLSAYAKPSFRIV